MPTFSPPRFAASSGPAPLTPDEPSAPVTGIGQSIYNATTELQQRKKALLATSDPASPYNTANKAASLGVLALQDPSNPLYAADTAAKRNLIGAQSQQNQQQRGYYVTNGGFIAQRQGENAALTAATHDTADLAAVAQAKLHDEAINRVRDQVGMIRPLEIDTQQDDTTPLPVGVARSRRTNADYIGQANKEKDAVRGLTLEDLRNNLAITGTNVDDVRLAGQTAGLNLSEAQAGAGYKSKLAGFNLSSAIDDAQYSKDLGGLALEDATTRAKYSGLVPYDDPENPAGIPQYITPAEQDRRDRAYQDAVTLQRIPQQQGLTKAREQYVATQEAGGSALAALTVSQLLDQYNTNAISPPGAGARLTAEQIKAEIVRRLVQKGTPQGAAEVAAEQLVADELEKRGEAARKAAVAAQNAGGGNTGPQIQRPAFGR